MLHFYKRIVMFGLFVLIGADVVDESVRTNREYQIDEKSLDVPTNNRSSSPGVRVDNEYGEFKIIQSNLLRITTPVYKLPLKRIVPDRGSATRKRRATSRQQGAPVGQNASLDSASGERAAADGAENRTLSHLNEDARAKTKHDSSKKKKKKLGASLHKIGHLMWHHISKMLPKISKMQGPFMFMLGMAQANFNNFVMHALMMSKMALISVFMMIMRELVFGDNNNPVRYYNFGYKHSEPHHYRKYSYYEPQVSDDYQQYDYKRRRKRQASF